MKKARQLLDTAALCALNDPLATSLLHLATRSALRDALYGALVEALYGRCVRSQTPQHLFALQAGEDGALDAHTRTVHIDLEAISGMHACAVAAVVGAGVALMCQADEEGVRRPAVARVVNSTVLVPVGCLPLYEAAQYLTGVKEEPPADDDEFRPAHLPCMDIVRNLSARELEHAPESCLTCIAALVGVINAACVAFPATWRILQVRHDPTLPLRRRSAPGRPVGASRPHVRASAHDGGRDARPRGRRYLVRGRRRAARKRLRGNASARGACGGRKRKWR